MILCDPKDLGNIIICAVRYACGRKTYMPSTVCDFITPLIPELDSKTLAVICGDIISAAECGGLGDSTIDEPLWRELYRVCYDEIYNRGDGLRNLRPLS